MSTSVTWPVIGGTTYAVPASGEVNWPALSNYLIALAAAQATTNQKIAIRKAVSSPVTVTSASDCAVVTDLTVPGAVAVSLPAGVAGQYYVLIDGKGDAASNNVTITPNGGDTIKGAANLVLNDNRAAVLLVYNSADTDWKVFGPIKPIVSLTSDVSGVLPVANGGTNSSTSLNNNRVMKSSGGAVVEASAITANKALSSDANGIPVASTTTDTELGYVSGVTSAIQTQLNTKAIGPGVSVDSEVAIYNGTGGETLKRASGTGVAHLTSGVLSASNVVLTSEVTGILPTANGGTGQNGSATFPTSGVVVTEAGTETLTNKTLTAPVISDRILYTETTTPATPAAGKLAVYPKSDHVLYKLDSNGIESAIGTGGGGAKNYLGTVNGSNGNGDFEIGTTSGWSLAHSSLTSNFPSTVGTAGNSFSSAGGAHGGSAASGNLTLSAVSSGQLAGSYSASYASSAATTAGDMLISDARTIDIEDQAKVLTFKCYYKAQSNAANGNFSGTSSNSFGFAIYDVTNAAWIMPAGVWNVVQSSGVGYATGTFQTTSNSTQYQLAWFNANASAGAITMYLDDFFLGPQTAPVGSSESDWQTYTPTINGGGSRTNELFMWRKSGPNLEIVGTSIMGNTTATPMYFTLPAGLAMDSAKLGAGNRCKVGDANRLTASGTTPNATGIYLALYFDGTNTDRIFVANTITSGGYTTSNTNSMFSSGDVLVFDVLTIPISGWGSNTSVSSDTDTRVVAASYYASAGGTTSTTQALNFDTKVFDTHGAVSASAAGTGTWTFAAPISGYYRVNGVVANSAGQVTWMIYKNGAIYAYVGSSNGTTATSNNLSYIIQLNAGDTIEIRTTNSQTWLGGAQNAGGTSSIEICRVSGPAVVAATESVNMRYYSSVSSISGSLATVTYATKDFDSHAAYSGGVYTAPVTGKYQVNAGILITGTIALNNNLIIEIQKNGTVVSRETVYFPATLTDGTALVSDIISCLAGDTVRIQVSCSATSPTIVSSNFDNYLSIARIGN